MIDEGVLKIIVGENLGLINVVNFRKVYVLLEIYVVKGKIVLEGF